LISRNARAFGPTKFVSPYFQNFLMDENTTHIIRVLLGTATDVERDSSDLCHEGVVLCFVAFLDDGRKHQGGIHEILLTLMS
jgi:hypothetical protein